MRKIFLENLREILTEKKMTQEALARKIRRKQPFISKLVRLEQAGSLTIAYQIAGVLGVTVEQLTGKPEQTVSPIEIRIEWEPARFPGKDPTSRFEGNFLPIPVYDINVVGGQPETIAREEIKDIALLHRSALRRKTARYLVCTYVKGDSMLPLLRDGAIVCIDTADRPERGKIPKGSIWAVRKEEGVVVKHLQIADGAIVLISANPGFPPDTISSAEAIVGRVIWVWQGL